MISVTSKYWYVLLSIFVTLPTPQISCVLAWLIEYIWEIIYQNGPLSYPNSITVHTPFNWTYITTIQSLIPLCHYTIPNQLWYKLASDHIDLQLYFFWPLSQAPLHLTIKPGNTTSDNKVRQHFECPSSLNWWHHKTLPVDTQSTYMSKFPSSISHI